MSEELSITEENNLSITNNLKSLQENFLDSSIGKVVNNALDIGLRALLPDVIEDEIINIKDSILENGFKDGIKEAINEAVSFGKSAIGVVTGKFDNVSQIETAIKKGGIIDTASDLLDTAIKTAQNKNLIDKSTATLIKNGKNTILKSVEDKIEDTLSAQIKNVEKLQSYSEKWNVAYEAQDLSEMDKNFKNIEKYIKETIPLENTINEARKIENLHNLIKNNGGNFNISEEEKKLAEKLVN
jgi:hypothetical protein